LPVESRISAVTTTVEAGRTEAISGSTLTRVPGAAAEGVASAKTSETAVSSDALAASPRRADPGDHLPGIAPDLPPPRNVRLTAMDPLCIGVLWRLSIREGFAYGR
jgi:hypothetical protein